MKGLGVLLLVGGFITGVFFITECATAGGGVLASQLLATRQGGGLTNQTLFGDFEEVKSTKPERLRHEEEKEPQLELFDKACEESIKEFYLRLAREKELQLEPFDKAFEESRKGYELRLAQEKEKIDKKFTLAKEKVKK